MKGTEMRFRRIAISALCMATLAVWAAPAMAASGMRGSIKVGVALTGVADTGTCNNTWAVDSYNKFYTLTANKDRTYNLKVAYRDGRFVTNAGISPGACESGTNNGKTVTAGITGNMHQTWKTTVTASTPPNRNPSCGTGNVNCSSATLFLAAVFGSGNATPGPWTYTGHYEAGRHGTWFDTMTNWPLNDRGDITSP